MAKQLALSLIIMMGKSLALIGQSNNLPGVIPSLFYKGSISNRFDYNVFASTTFIVTKSTIEGYQYPSRNSEFYIQPSLIYKHSDVLNFAVGYTYVNGNNFTEARETEQMIWQQAIIEHRAIKGLMLHRFRLVENLKKDIAPVFNYQVAFEKPLEGRVLDAGEFYFTCFNESFLNFSSTARFYSANWAFAGVGYKTLKAGKFEVGPLIQTTFTPQQGNNTLLLLQILWLCDSKLFKGNDK